MFSVQVGVIFSLFYLSLWKYRNTCVLSLLTDSDDSVRVLTRAIIFWLLGFRIDVIYYFLYDYVSVLPHNMLLLFLLMWVVLIYYVCIRSDFLLSMFFHMHILQVLVRLNTSSVSHSTNRNPQHYDLRSLVYLLWSQDLYLTYN